MYNQQSQNQKNDSLASFKKMILHDAFHLAAKKISNQLRIKGHKIKPSMQKYKN